jgi:hypothetical protein
VKRPVGNHRRVWEDNIKIDRRNCEGVNWSYVAFDKGQCWALVNTIMNLLVS